jgi:hypothetical protein
MNPGSGTAADEFAPLTYLLSFQLVADVPFDAFMAAVEKRLTEHGGELRLGNGRLLGPAEPDQFFGTRRLEVRLGRGPLRPAVRMRLDIAPWSPAATTLELIPCQRVKPSAGYFAAGRRLLDSLTPAVMTPVSRRPGLGFSDDVSQEGQVA